MRWIYKWTDEQINRQLDPYIVPISAKQGLHIFTQNFTVSYINLKTFHQFTVTSQSDKVDSL